MDKHRKEELIKIVIGVVAIISIAITPFFLVVQYEKGKQKKIAKIQTEKKIAKQADDKRQDEDYEAWLNEKKYQEYKRYEKHKRILAMKNEEKELGEVLIVTKNKFSIETTAKGKVKRIGNRIILNFNEIELAGKRSGFITKWNAGLAKRIKNGWDIVKRGKENTVNNWLEENETIRIKNHFSEISLSDYNLENIGKYWLIIEVEIIDKEFKKAGYVYGHDMFLKLK